MTFDWPGRSGDQIRDEVLEELEFHLAARVRDLVAEGMEPEAARRRAAAELGDVGEARRAIEGIDRGTERTRRRANWLLEFAQDAKIAVRALRRSPAFAALAIATFSLGIGITTSVYGILDAVLLRPLSFPNADRVVVPQSIQRGTDQRFSVSYGDIAEWREARVFQRIAAFQSSGFDLRVGNQAVRASVLYFEADLVPILGIEPALGRLPGPPEFDPGGPRAMLLSDRFWRARFGADSSIVGSTTMVAGFPVTIAGVLPPIDEPPFDQDVWYPLRQGTPDADELRRDNFVYQSVALLAPGQTIEAARRELDTRSAVVEREFPRIRQGVASTVDPLSLVVFGRGLIRSLWAFMLGVLFVALIGCVNVANLLLARGATREPELAVRSALGAGSFRLLRQMIAETSVLAAIGCIGGVGIAWYGTRALVRLFPVDTPRLDQAGVDGQVLGFAVLGAILSALASGLYPAMRVALGASRFSAAVGARGGTSRGDQRVRAGLVFAESLLSAVLIVAALLAVVSVRRLVRVDPGFDPSGQITVDVRAPAGGPRSADARSAFFEQLAGRLERILGVRAAAGSWAVPLGGGGFYLGRSVVAAPDSPDAPANEVQVMWNIVTPGYWRASGIPLIAGRDFTVADDSAGAPVIIVNRALAHRLFGDSSALGHRILSSRDERVWREIVGVVGDVRLLGLDDRLGPIVYVPHRQDPTGRMVMTLRTAGDPTALGPSIRAALAEVDPNVAAANLRTMIAARDQSTARYRATSVLATTFAALALILAAIGIFGVVTYTVARRGREVGIRMALGARPGRVVWLVVRQAAAPAVTGVIAGLVLARWLGVKLEPLLYGTTAGEPAIFAAAGAVLIGVSLLAAQVPASRAARVDPSDALRAD